MKNDARYSYDKDNNREPVAKHEPAKAALANEHNIYCNGCSLAAARCALDLEKNMTEEMSDASKVQLQQMIDVADKQYKQLVNKLREELSKATNIARLLYFATTLAVGFIIGIPFKLL